MGFEEVKKSGGAYKKTSTLKKGESITGYLARYEERNGEYGEQIVGVFQDPDTGEQYTLFPSGELKYTFKDQSLKVGLLTRITSEGKVNRITKKGREYQTTAFKAEQDPEDTIEVAVSTPASSASDVAERAAALKKKQLG